jgi:hypothetical protein
MTNIPRSRKKVASCVKSESEVTRQKPLTFFWWKRSTASMTSEMSVEFLPEMFEVWWTAVRARSREAVRQEFMFEEPQSP